MMGAAGRQAKHEGRRFVALDEEWASAARRVKQRLVELTIENGWTAGISQIMIKKVACEKTS